MYFTELKENKGGKFLLNLFIVREILPTEYGCLIRCSDSSVIHIEDKYEDMCTLMMSVGKLI